MEIISVLLPIVLPQILECLDRDGDERTLGNLRRGGPRVQFRIYRGLRKCGCSRKEAREQTPEVLRELREASEEEIKDLFAEARSADD